MPSESLYQFTPLPTVLKKVPLSPVCHFSLDSGFNTVYFRALMKSTAVINGSISTQLITFQKEIQQPHQCFRNHFLISDLLRHTAKTSANVCAYLCISGVFKNIRNFAAAFDFRPSFLFSTQELIIYSQEILKSKNIMLPLLSSWVPSSNQSRISESHITGVTALW